MKAKKKANKRDRTPRDGSDPARQHAMRKRHYAVDGEPPVCGECGQPAGPIAGLYRRCPLTGRRTSAVWCDDCYERSILQSDRARGQQEIAVRKVA